MRHLPLLFLLLLNLPEPCSASLPDKNAPLATGDTLRWSAGIRSNLSEGSHTPFWLMNNLQGIGSPRKDNGFITTGIFKDPSPSKRFSWEAGAEIAAAVRMEAPFLIRQLYAEARYRSVSILAGAKEMWSPYNNPLLSSGDLLFSGNSLPIPQIRAGIFDYAPLWGCKGWFSVRGYIAYGRFTDSRWQESWVAPEHKRTENVLFHSKGLWIKGGDGNRFPLTAEVGIEMASQFGGRSIKNGETIKMESGWKAWLRALFPHYREQPSHAGTVNTVEGNMTGCYDIALSWTPQADWSIRGYFEHYFEDESQMTFEYGWKDGLWGLEVSLPRNPAVTTVVAEYLHTRDQTGPILNQKDDLIHEQISGRDNYYSNSLYQGWNHWGLTIGNPLLLSPLYNADHELTSHATRVQAWHLGVAGNPLPGVSYRLLLSYSRNWGTYTKPLPDVYANWNALAEMRWHPRQLPGWSVTLGIAADGGKLLGKSAGMSLGVAKSGDFSLSSLFRKKKGGAK